MPSTQNIVHVAVAVIGNADGQYLIAKRPQLSHQGGLWEFPGGKVEKGESVLQALKRELFEELGIKLLHAIPLIRIPHNYGDKSVLLDVWRVEHFSEEAFGKEGQQIRWIKQDDFSSYSFPAANKPIINAVQLPDKYMITGEFKNEKELLGYIQSGLDRGIKLIQFRAHNLDEDLFFEYGEKVHALCKKENARLLLNSSVKNYKKYRADTFSNGLHLSSKEIKLFSSTDLNEEWLVATSVHNQEELFVAQDKGIDFCVLSPVNKTLSHPDSSPLGWEQFQQLTEKASVPVYALGGMVMTDLAQAKKNGAQGISAIGEFWHA